MSASLKSTLTKPSGAGAVGVGASPDELALSFEDGGAVSEEDVVVVVVDETAEEDSVAEDAAVDDTLEGC